MTFHAWILPILTSNTFPDFHNRNVGEEPCIANMDIQLGLKNFQIEIVSNETHIEVSNETNEETNETTEVTNDTIELSNETHATSRTPLVTFYITLEA